MYVYVTKQAPMWQKSTHQTINIAPIDYLKIFLKVLATC